MAKKDESRVNWDQVNKWLGRAGLKTNWLPFGMPEILDPFGSRFGAIEPMPRWDIPRKVFIATAITGAFFSKKSNPNQPISVEEIRSSAEECIKAGAPSIHIHVRDDRGFNVLSTERFRAVIEPLREKYPNVAFDGCLVATTDDESAEMGQVMDTRLLDVIPVNTTAICCGDSMFFKAPHVVIQKTKMIQDRGLKPVVAVYADGDIDNARRFLIDTGLLKKPYYWLILPALPGCSPMHTPEMMIDGLMRMVRAIRQIDDETVIGVCAAGRPSTYLATLALVMGLHVRVGMEDTVWKWPHRDDILDSNVAQFKLACGIAEALGREVMTPHEYRELVGIASPASANNNLHK
jgi:3-keto-5-aminohexanoate cleavage enzyme